MRWVSKYASGSIIIPFAESNWLHVFWRVPEVKYASFDIGGV